MNTKAMPIRPPGRTHERDNPGPTSRASEAGQAVPYLVSKEAHRDSASAHDPCAEFTELYSFGIERAMKIGQASLAAAVCLNSCVMEIYKDSFGFAPAIGNYFELSSRLFARCAEQQINLLGLFLPKGVRKAEVAFGVAYEEEAELVEGVFELEARELERETERLEHCMDIAIGAHAA